VIEYPKLLPDMNEFWVMDILDYDYKVMAEESHTKGVNWSYYTLVILSCIFLGVVGYLGVGLKKK
jgi:hypothetical protein